MAFGLKVYSATGALKLNITDRLPREISRVTGALTPGSTVVINKPTSNNPVYFEFICTLANRPQYYAGNPGDDYGNLIQQVESTSTQLIARLYASGYDDPSYNYTVIFYSL
jgi:hypothetical protein